MKLTKSGMLIILLVLPLLFYLFLRFFGKNTYSVPKYYATGITPQGDSTYYTIPGYENGKITVIHFLNRDCLNSAKTIEYLQKAFEKYSQIQFVSYINADSKPPCMNTFEVDDSKWKHFLVNNETTLNLTNEIYKLNQKLNSLNTLVLTDKQGVIRGYYDKTKPKEIDRIINEISVILLENNK